MTPNCAVLAAALVDAIPPLPRKSYWFKFLSFASDAKMN
jgi:hypothetical protein